MLIFAPANLAVFATPKTGSTALYLAFRKHAQIAMVGQPRFKHVSLTKYERHIAPMLAGGFGLVPERAAAIREPLDYLASWYRYRQRPDMARAHQSAAGVSFEEFALAAISDAPPPYAAVGRQMDFLSAGAGVAVDHLFTQEDELLPAFIADRIGLEKVKLGRQNVSPAAPTDIAPTAAARIRAAWASDCALWQRVADAGGYLALPRAAP